MTLPTTNTPPSGPNTGGTGPQITPTVRFKRCCKAVLAREKCDCRNVRRQTSRRPAIVFNFGSGGASC